ncbi:nuclear pore complex protein DDB_G0274915 [Culicoides brevitarsis]|uniref:nuclear pore complex protein DDB_G0274915 n=1 Tax=Culicoides brevitarsis TaxID=469753 RepID=UPI00307B2FC1
MEKRRSSINSSLNISESLVAPQANSTRIVSNFIGSSQKTGVKRKPTSPLSSRNAMSKTSLGTICYNRSLDPQTYSDITSQGLTSRLVRYGGNVQTTETNKPSPLRSAYLKKSAFPMIKLKKDGNKPSAQRSQSLSCVRIAPPEKVTFQPNARSSILRSGSMIAMPNLGGMSRRDNEPLNPASNEHGSNPTRSVLDELQEISRKRINNEELDTERIKKQCKNITEVDGTTTYQNNTLSDFSGTMSDLVYRSPIMQKRTREGQPGQTSPSSAELEKQKKRLCTKNNEVASSLSSSISLATPKRQVNELNTRKGLDLNKEPPEETPVNVATQQIPTRSGVIKEVPQSNLVVQVPVLRKEPKPVKNDVPTAPKLTLFNKKYDDMGVKDADLEETTEKKSRFVKPKASDEDLDIKSVKKVEQSKLAVLLKCLAGELDDDPAEDAVDSSKKEEPKTETPAKIELKMPEAPKVTAPVIEIPSQPLKLPEIKPLETKKPEENTQKNEKPAVSFNLNTEPAKSVAPLIQPTTASKPSFTFGSTPAATTASSSPSASNPVVTSTISGITSLPSLVVPSSTAATTKAETNSNTSFMFGNISNTESLPKPLISAPTSAFTATSAPSSTPAFSFGSNATPAASVSTAPSTTSGSQPSQTSKPSFVFGASSAGNNESKPALPTFGAIASTNSTSIPSSTTAVASPFGASSTPSSTFNFGAPKTSTAAPSQPSAIPSLGSVSAFKLPETQPASQAAPVFGQSTQPSTTSSVFGSSTTPASTTNSVFGSSTTPASTTNSVFGSSTTPASTTNSVFGSSTTPASTTNPVFGSSSANSGTFTFGQQPSKPAETTFGQNSIFGATNNQSNTASQQPSGGFSFNAAPKTTQPSAPGGFSFNASTNAAPASQEPQKPSVFSRLGGVAPAASTQNASSAVSPSKSLFTFSSSSNANQEKPSSNAPPAFGSNMTNVSSISNTSSIFGGNTTMNSTAQNTTIFGNTSTGGNLFGAQQPQKESTGGIFGGATSNPPAFGATSTFGSNVTSPTAPSTGFGQKSTFNFGGSTNNNNATNNTPSNSSAPFTFGQSATSAPAATDNKPFTFGGSSAPPAYPGPATSQEPPKFNFTAQGAGTNSPFGQSNNNTPSFGGSTGGITPSPGAFNFTAGANNNSGNVFGSASSGGSTAGSTGAFNFSAAAPNPAAPQGGLSFNIGTGGQSQQGRRPIRTATRRLK